MSFRRSAHSTYVGRGGLCRICPNGRTREVQLFSLLIKADRLEVAKEVLSSQEDVRTERGEGCAEKQFFAQEKNVDARDIEVLLGRAARR